MPSDVETIVASFTATTRTVLTLATCTGEWAARVNVYLNGDYQDGRSLNSAAPNAVVPFDLDLTIGDVVEVKALQDSGVDRLYDASIHAYTW